MGTYALSCELCGGKQVGQFVPEGTVAHALFPHFTREQGPASELAWRSRRGEDTS